MNQGRRDFLIGLSKGAAAVGVVGYGGLGVASLFAGEPPAEPVGTRIDFHSHLFGEGHGGTGCFLSKQQKEHFNYRFFRALLDIDDKKGPLDAQYLTRIIADLRASSIDKTVLLAQDGRYDKRGKFLRAETHFYVPNDYLLEVCAQHPDLFVPCVSINPARADALDELAKCKEGGARVLKIHPPTQDVDPGEERFRPFYRKLAEAGILLMVHTGTEHASHVAHPAYASPARLEPALQEGCTVIAAHSGLGSFHDSEDFFPPLVELARRYDKLYCDTGNLGGLLRWRNLPRLLATPELEGRLLHASDYPFPPDPLVHWPHMAPGKLLDLLPETNIFERDYRLKLALGMPKATFELGARLLEP
jgi:uncharacterized protein